MGTPAPFQKPRTTLEGTLHCVPDYPDSTQGGRSCRLDTRLSHEACQTRTPASGSDLIMEAPMFTKSAKDKTDLGIIVLCACLLQISQVAGTSPHTPKQLTWLVNSQTGDTIWSATGTHALGTWWPSLTLDFCSLAAGSESWDLPDTDPRQLPVTDQGKRFSPGGQFGCGELKRRASLGKLDFYVCPKQGRDRATARRCGVHESLYCAAWGCETTGEAYWKPSSSWDWIRVTKNYTTCSSCANNATCLPLKVVFTSPGKQSQNLDEWIKGRTWGLRWYFPNRMRA